VYEGNWECDKKNGEGTFVAADGKTSSGFWKEDRPPKTGKLKFLVMKIDNKSKHQPSLTYGINFPKENFETKFKKTVDTMFN